MRNRKRMLVVSVVILAVLGGIGGGMAGGGRFFRNLVFANGERASLGYRTTPDANASSARIGADSLETVKAERVVEDDFLRLTGTLAADEKANVASTTNGIVKTVHVERGSLVEEGDVLVTVDPTDMQNALAEGEAAIEELKAALGWKEGQKTFDPDQQPGVLAAKAGLDLAKANFERYKGLAKENAVSRIAYDQVRVEYETAQQRHQQALYQARQLYQSYNTALARLVTLKKLVADTTIKAPFSGLVVEKLTAPGERVTTTPIGSGATVVAMVRIDPLRLVLTVPQQYASSVHEGQQVKFSVEAFPDRSFAGEVRFIGPSLEVNSRSLTVEAVVPNADKVLRPGFFASAELIIPGQKERFVIPESALVRKGDVNRVYVVRDGTVTEKVLDVDEVRDSRAYVKSGLVADDAVVIKPDEITKTAEAQS